MPASGISPKAPTTLDWATLPTRSNSTRKRHSTRRSSEADRNPTYDSLSTWRGRTRAFGYVRWDPSVSQIACSGERVSERPVPAFLRQDPRQAEVREDAAVGEPDDR